jgi:hypothetical protein
LFCINGNIIIIITLLDQTTATGKANETTDKNKVSLNYWDQMIQRTSPWSNCSITKKSFPFWLFMTLFHYLFFSPYFYLATQIVLQGFRPSPNPKNSFTWYRGGWGAKRISVFQIAHMVRQWDRRNEIGARG